MRHIRAVGAIEGCSLSYTPAGATILFCKPKLRCICPVLTAASIGDT